MRILLTILVLCVLSAGLGCSGDSEPSTPRKTFEAYIRALKQKNTAAMKRLLTAETLKMHEQEAKSMGTTVDEIVKREMLVSEGQKVVEYRNEKIDGNKATLEVKTGRDSWDTVYFLLEDGVWKIDKKGWADQLMKEVEEEDRKSLDEMNVNRPIPFDTASPFPTPPLDSANTNQRTPEPQDNNPDGPLRRQRSDGE